MSSLTSWAQRATWTQAVLLAAAVFAVVTSGLSVWLTADAPVRYNSPDETANAFFTRRLASGQGFVVADPFNRILAPHSLTVAPRGLAVSPAGLIPSSFLGFPTLVGSLVRVFGEWALPFLLPVLSAGAGIAWYYFLRRFFPDAVTALSTLLLFVSPPFVYYTVRGMMHNGLFLDLLIFSAVSLTVFIERRSNAFGFLGGALLGLSLFVRTAEVWWIVLLLAFVVAKNRSLGVRWLAVGGGILFGLTPMFLANADVFGGPLRFAYAVPGLPTDSAEASAFATAAGSIFPFGVDFARATTTAWQYLAVAIPWFGVPVLLGLLSSFFPPRAAGRFEPLFRYGAIGVTVWLILTYGSWHLIEAPEPHDPLLGSSYLRYWLPIVLVLTPYAAFGLTSLARIFRPARTAVGVLLALLVFIHSVSTLGFNPLHGLRSIRASVKAESELARRVAAATPPDAVIVTGTNDKVVFPDRRPVVALPDDPTSYARGLRLLAKVAPVFLLADETQPSLETATRKLGGTLEPVMHDGSVTLYAFRVP